MNLSYFVNCSAPIHLWRGSCWHSVPLITQALFLTAVTSTRTVLSDLRENGTEAQHLLRESADRGGHFPWDLCHKMARARGHPLVGRQRRQSKKSSVVRYHHCLGVISRSQRCMQVTSLMNKVGWSIWTSWVFDQWMTKEPCSHTSHINSRSDLD